MTPSELEARASALYGAQWQSALARVVRVDARTVRRWYAGDRAIPAWLEVLLPFLEDQAARRGS